ncbi:MAG: HD domain-containing protein [Lachnospiraceae bacterium]|nr:HD domain-containing protein [Lachnospiraceae bacterium]
MAYELKVNFNDIMNIYSKNHKVGGKRDIKLAYEYALEKHYGVVRGTGEPYINHPLRVARHVTEWGFESDVIVSALLHDVVEDCDVPLSEIEDRFGSSVAKIVDTVTALSDKDFSDHTPSKEQIDLLSDARLQKKMNEKALYVKIADRIDNLNTLSGVKEAKRIPKAEHTREIIIPMAKIEKAYHFVDILEELCFQTEHTNMYEEIAKQYKKIYNINSRRLQESLDTLSSVFDPHHNNETQDLDRYHRLIVNFMHDHRSYISIFRQISHSVNNIKEDLTSTFTKENIALLDLTLVVSDELSDENSNIRPNDIFFQYFDKALSGKGFYFIKYTQTTYKDTGYFLIADTMDNLYRLFVRTETEYQRFMYGNIIDADSFLAITDINEIEPRDTYNEKIKVFRKDNSSMLIDKGATVLDFAFYIHSDLGLHFLYAMIDDSKTHLPPYTRLNEGDKITIVADEDAKPEMKWFNAVKTSKASHFLVRYFSDPDHLKEFLQHQIQEKEGMI